MRRIWGKIKVVMLAIEGKSGITGGNTMNDKTKALIAYIASKQKVSVTSLMKICYICDLLATKRGLGQISKFSYIRYNYGPFDSNMYAYLKSLTDNGTLTTKTEYADNVEYAIYSTNTDEHVNLSLLSEAEKKIVNEVCTQLDGYGAKALTEVAYKTKPMVAIGATLGGNESLGATLNLSV